MKKTVFLCYNRCTTCKKAEKWLDENGVVYEKRPVKEENPSADELRDWHARSGLPLKRFFNTSGQLYRQNNLKDRIPSMTEEEMYGLLASDGMLVKRPMLISEDFVLVGFKEEEWKNTLL